MALVIHVEFTTKPKARDRFRELVVENATLSREAEPGCRQFDVCHDPSDPDRVVLYEVYDDAAAFDAHTSYEHFTGFDRASADLVVRKVVSVLSRTNPS